MSDKTYEQITAERDARKANLEKAKEEQRQRDLVELDRLEREHGDKNIMAVHTIGGLVVIGRPSKGSMKRWREAKWSDKARPSQRFAAIYRAVCDLAKSCILYPTAPAYAALCEEYPGIPDVVCAAAVRFAGMLEKEEA